MPRYIDADALVKSVLEPGIWDGLNNQCTMLNLIAAAPTVRALEVQHAIRQKLETPEAPRALYESSCPLCASFLFATDDYCATCGAKMDSMEATP